MKIAVVGSGIAGIAAAVRLALLKNTEVHVFEANDYPGGKLTAFSQEGYRFDAGPSLFTMPYLVDELFRAAGENPKDFFNYEKLTIACNYFWEDGKTLSAFTDSNRFGQEVETNFGVSKRVIKDYLDHSALLYNKTAGLFLEQSLHRWSTYFSKDVLHALVHVHQFDLMKTMHKSNKEKLREPHLVQLFNRFATYNGSSPYKAPGVLNIIPHLEHNQGAFFPKGGMHEITLSLVKLASKLGVFFHFETPVKSIEVERGHVVGIRLNESDFASDLVVSNMDVVPTYRKLLPDHPAPERTLNQERSSSALIFYWGIAASFPQLDLHNIFFTENYRAEFESLFDRKELYTDPTVYVNISSKYAPEDAPEGKENWFVMINVPGNYQQDWEALIPKAKKCILDKLSRILNRDIGALIETENILDPRGIETKTSSYLGALYGSSSNNRFSAFLRHPNFSQRIKGLYFCGGSVHPGGGIPLCLLSGKIVADLVKKDHGLELKHA